MQTGKKVLLPNFRRRWSLKSMRDAPLDLPLRARSKHKKKRRRRKNTTRRAPRPRRTSFFRSLVVADDFLMMRVFFILRVVARIRRCALKTRHYSYFYINTKKLLFSRKKTRKEKTWKRGDAYRLARNTTNTNNKSTPPQRRRKNWKGGVWRVFVVFLFFTSPLPFYPINYISLLDSIVL